MVVRVRELAALALDCAAGSLRACLAAWLNANSDPDELSGHHHRRRSLTWRTDPDGTVTLRLPPHLAAVLISLVTTLVMRSRPRPDASAAWRGHTHHSARRRGGSSC